MARYRLTGKVAFNNPFRLISTRRVTYEGWPPVAVPDGPDVPDGRELFSVLLDAGAVVEVEDSLVPNSAMQPLDEAAEAQVAKYPQDEFRSDEEKIAALTPLFATGAKP